MTNTLNLNQIKNIQASLDKLRKSNIKKINLSYLQHLTQINKSLIKDYLNNHLDKLGLWIYYQIDDPNDWGTSVHILSLDDIKLGQEFENPDTGEIFELTNMSQVTTWYLLLDSDVE